MKQSDRDQERNRDINHQRRRLLSGLAATAAGISLSGCGGGSSSVSDSSPQDLPPLPAPAESGIDHIVVVMMENRSFDHYLGWVPGADGVQAGRSFTDTNGATQSSHDLAPNYQNCASADPDHSYAGGRKHLNGGAMDGFLLTQPVGDTFPIGYYGADSLPFFKGVVDNYTICDRYFSGILSSTYPNRFYMHAGQTDRVSNTTAISTLPTIWDSMKAAGYSAHYYFSDAPFLALWGGKYLGTTLPVALFKAAAATGTLPNLSFVDPAEIGEGSGISKDDHPLADIRDGQAFLNDIYDTLRNSPQWDKTLLIINYDEWGGFADHVVPPMAPVTPAEFAATQNDGRLGFRVPCAIIGPRAKRNHVEHLQFDPNSILNMIAWRFGFEPLGARSTSINLAHALDFDNPPNTAAPAFDVGNGPFGSACRLQDVLPSGTSTAELDEVSRRQAEHLLEWQTLQMMARRYGFAV